jgi:hypothetical protein
MTLTPLLLACAWILWAVKSDEADRITSWQMIKGYPSVEECRTEAALLAARPAFKDFRRVQLTCLPDTVEPRRPHL